MFVLGLCISWIILIFVFGFFVKSIGRNDEIRLFGVFGLFILVILCLYFVR